MEGFLLIDSGCSRHMTGDRRWFSNLTLVMTKEYITFRDNGKGRVLSVGTVMVSESVTLQCVSLVKFLGYNLLTVSQLLDEGFEIRFKTGFSHVLDSRGDHVCTIVPEGQIFSEPIFLSVLALLVSWLLVFWQSFGNGIGD
jgi:hypothetical protein